MRRIVNIRPQPGTSLLLAALPFVLLVAAYLIGSQARLAVNPNDKLLPAFSTIAAALHEMALVPDQRSGDYLFWTDTPPAWSGSRPASGSRRWWGWCWGSPSAWCRPWGPRSGPSWPCWR